MTGINKKIAIIIVNYNGLKDTIECIRSIEKMEYSDNCSIIVVDNASDDDEFLAISRSFPSVYIIRSNENLGFAGGNNLGIEYAINNNYDYIMLLNNDTVVEPHLIANFLAVKSENCILAPQICYYSKKNIVWYGGGEINKKTGNVLHYGMNKPTISGSEVKECTFATGCCVFMSRHVVEIIGLLDDTYFMYGEDAEYCLRAMYKNVKIKYISNAIIWHKVSQSAGGEKSAFCIYYITRNRLKYINDYKSFFSVWAYPFSLITRYVRATQYALRGRCEWRAFITGIRDHYRGVTGKAEKLM